MRIADEKDPEIIRQAALLLEAENHRLNQKILQLTRELLALQGADPTQLQLKLQVLEEQLAATRRKLFGASSERREGEEPRTEPAKDKSPRTGHGPHPQPQLPIVEVKHELDEADRVCPSCGGQLTEWGGQFEESEEIDVLERQFVLRRHKRQKYRCGCQACVETAPPPKKLFEGARYSIDFAIDVAIAKYLDHMPLERQVRVMLREGLVVESQTLWDQLDALARHLLLAHQALHRYVLLQPVIGGDETRWRLLGKDGSDGGPANWQVWSITAPNAVSYRIEDSRSTKAAERVLGGYQGILMADGYAAYDSLRKQGAPFQLAYCWSHVRRKFVDIEEFFPDDAGQAIGLIRELYDIESACPRGSPGDELRRQLRNARSRDVVARLHAWALSVRALPESGLGRAIAYMGKLWPGLVRFLEDPRIPLDNNATERALRGVVIGRKNHYGSRSRRGTEVAALFYSLVESAKLAGVEPRAYLRQAVLAALDGERIPLPHELAGIAA